MLKGVKRNALMMAKVYGGIVEKGARVGVVSTATDELRREKR